MDFNPIDWIGFVRVHLEGRYYKVADDSRILSADGFFCTHGENHVEFWG